jgi:ParB/RepB/Spo0J family partition protein
MAMKEGLETGKREWGMRSVELKLLLPTVDNPRASRGAKDPKLLELAESMKAHGVLVPVICRPHPERKGFFDLRAGFRRLEAAKLAGLKEIPAVVRAMTDRQAMEITVLENLQRENLTPLEEAKGIKSLLAVGKDVAAIAADIGKPPAWVVRRAKLCDLTPEWKKAIEDPEHDFSHLQAGHLELIARHAPEVQKELFGEYGQRWNTSKLRLSTLKDLEHELAVHLRALGKAAFDPKDDLLQPKAGACTACQKRSSCQPGLFADELDPAKLRKSDKCLDPACYDAKLAEFTMRKEAALKAQHPGALVISADWSNDDEDVLNHNAYELCKKGAKGAKPAVYRDGPQAGTLTWVKVNEDATSRGGRKPGPDGKAKPKTLAERRAALECRRWALVIKETLEALDKSVLPAVGVDAPDGLLMALVASFGAMSPSTYDKEDHVGLAINNPTHKSRFDILDLYRTAPAETVLKQVWNLLEPRLSETVKYYQVGGITERHQEACRRIGKLLGIDVQAEFARICTVIKEPSAWKNLDEDGAPKTQGYKYLHANDAKV